MCRCLAFALLVGLIIVPGTGAQPLAVARLDALGDPLPQGAIARLGTLRFKHTLGVTYPFEVSSDVYAAAFSKDGKTIASLASPFGKLRLWNAATGQELRGPWLKETIEGKAYQAIAFSP